MALMHVNFYSQALGIACSMDVILPELAQGIGVDGMPSWDGVELLPVLYLLHGTSHDHTICQRRTSIERYVSGKKLAVVMPAVARSTYTDQVHGYDYWTFVSEELPSICQKLFRISPRREDNFAAGLSMGGYGAMKLGLRCPEKYAAVASLSGGLDRLSAQMKQYSAKELSDPAFLRELKKSDPVAYDRASDFLDTFGSVAEYSGSDNDLFAVLERLAKVGGPFPDIYMAIGTEDFHYEPNQRFRAKLDEYGVPYTYEEGPGIHEWAFWDKYIQNVIRWLPIK